MSLIGSINSELVLKLAGPATSGSQSKINGKGVSSTFDSGGVDFQASISTIGNAFQNSYLRLNSAINVVTFTTDTLKKFLDITKELISLAERTADGGSIQALDRGRANTKFQSLIREYREILNSSSSSGIDLLNKDDIEAVLTQAGIDPGAATDLAQLFKRLAGLDDIFGYEKFRIDPQTITDQQTQIVGAGTFSPQFSTGGDGTFIAATTEFIGDGSVGAEIINDSIGGDLNGDGYADLLVTSRDQNAAYVSISNGDGTFLAQVSYSFAAAPSQVRLSDLNADGLADMVVGQSNSTFQVMLGNSNGSFNAGVSYRALNAGVTIAELGDLNGDGKVDVATFNGNSFGYHLGNGDGTFKSIVTASTTMLTISQVGVNDLNGDSLSDFIVQGSVGGGAPFASTVLLTQGDGTFNRVATLAGFGVAAGNTLADINKDGVLDLVTSYSTGATFGVNIGNGNGTFRTTVSYNAGSGRNDVAVFDVDGDGNADVVTTSTTDGEVSISSGVGDGTFNFRTTTTTLANNFSLSVADYNGDSKPDLFVGSLTANTGIVQLGQGALWTTGGLGIGSNPTGIATGYFNDDSFTDFAALDGAASGPIRVYMGNGNGTFKVGTTVGIQAAIGTDPLSIAAADFNSDGVVDFAVNTGSSNNVEVMLGNGDGTFKSSGLSFLGGNSYNMFATKLYGDNNQDLILADSSSSNIWLLAGHGNGTFKARVSLATTGAAQVATVGDLNFDGVSDIAAAVGVDGKVEVFYGNADGSFAAVRSFTVQGSSPKDVLIGDFLGTGGYNDLVVLTEAGKTIELFEGNGDGTFKASLSIATRQEGLEISSTDLNADGLLDLVATTRSPLIASKSYLEVYLNQGSGSFARPVTYEQGARTTNAITGSAIVDTNSDGINDLYSISSSANILPFYGSSKSAVTVVTQTGLGQSGSGDPLKTQINSRGNASVAYVALQRLSKIINSDLKGLKNVIGELEKARSFARAGVLALDGIARKTLTSNAADALASEIRESIQREARGAVSDSYTKLDGRFLSELFRGSIGK